MSRHSSDDDRLVLDYDRSEYPHYYEFVLYVSTGENGAYSRDETEDSTRPDVEFNNLIQERWYKARGRNCNNSNRTDCGDWSRWSNKVSLTAAHTPTPTYTVSPTSTPTSNPVSTHTPTPTHTATPSPSCVASLGDVSGTETYEGSWSSDCALELP